MGKRGCKKQFYVKDCDEEEEKGNSEYWDGFALHLGFGYHRLFFSLV
jgi:hypothetical protein